MGGCNQRSKNNILEDLLAKSADNQLKVLDQEEGCRKKHNKTQENGATKDILRNERKKEKRQDEHIISQK